MKYNIPLFKVFMSPVAGEALLKVLYSGFLGQGKMVDDFEQMVSSKLDLPYVLTLNSGTSALHLAYQMVMDGDENSEFIVSPITCSASLTPIIANKGKIVWSDVEPISGNIDPVDIERKITKNTKAIIMVHWGGNLCDIKRINELAKHHGIKTLEDGAHSLGATLDGKHVGSFSDMSMYSLQAIKHITSIDGGLLICKDKEYYERAKLLRWYGIDRTENRQVTDLRCLHPNTRIKFTDGTSMRISEVVKNKINKEVYVFENNKFVARKIINWYETPRNNRNFYKVYTTEYTSTRASIVTEDHKILTKDGWKEVRDVKNGELVLMSTIGVSSKQKSVLIGSLLGDGYLNTRKRKSIYKAHLQERHTTTQREYTFLKADIFSNFNVHKYEMLPNKEQRRPKGAVGYYTDAHAIFMDYQKLFYNEFYKKIIPIDFLEENFDDFALAIWFMDDGCTKIRNQIEGLLPDCQIATNSFSEVEVEELVTFLKKRGLDCYKGNHAGWRIFFTKEGSLELVKRIAKYVPKSMRYKVGHLPQLDSFNNELWELIEDYTPYYGHAVVEKKGKDANQTVYCIKVDSPYDNFQSTSVVLHNCEIDVKESGHKFHMNDCNAVVGMENFKHLNEILAKHRNNAKYYDSVFANTNVGIVKPLPNVNPAYWLYTINIYGEGNRDKLMQLLKEDGIGTSKVHASNVYHSMFKQFYKDLPMAEQFNKTHLCIPVGWWVTTEEREYISDRVLYHMSKLDGV